MDIFYVRLLPERDILCAHDQSLISSYTRKPTQFKHPDGITNKSIWKLNLDLKRNIKETYSTTSAYKPYMISRVRVRRLKYL